MQEEAARSLAKGYARPRGIGVLAVMAVRTPAGRSSMGARLQDAQPLLMSAVKISFTRASIELSVTADLRNCSTSWR